ncbi:MAG: 30S ribosomal protein S6 [Gemmataceae bacterium]|nr:30S ribosomal protein S6 [Gemmataceae bacterium]MCI0741757.1 30S ribosomal protein S6 [Gemmataceae bacterium]
MAAKVYECMFLLDTTKVAGDVAAADKQLRGLLEKNNAEVLVARPWDERRLTYPIRKQKKGLYYLTYFSAEGKSLVNIEHDCALNEMILRMLVLNIHPKMVDTMLSLAKGEHAVALHNYQEPAAEEATAPVAGPVDEAAPPPRKRKEKAEAKD